MNFSLSLDIIAGIVILSSLFVYLFSFLYWRRQKRECQKYPFYQMRSEVLRAYVHAKELGSDDIDDYARLYRLTNDTAKHLDRFGFAFFSASVRRLCDLVLEAEIGSGELAEKIEDIKIESEIGQLLHKFLNLLSSATIKNSFRVRLISSTRTTQVAYYLLHLLVALTRFTGQNSLRLKKHRENIETAKASMQIRDRFKDHDGMAVI